MYKLSSEILIMENYPWISIAGGLIAICVTISWTGFLKESQDQGVKEPPVRSPKVPIIGHVLGLMQEGNMYLVQLLYAYLPALCYHDTNKHKRN